MFVPSSEQVRFLDKYTVEHTPISSLNLMERASEAFVKRLLEDFDVLNYTILVGFGNNGGDGLAIGRLLFSFGKNVSLYLIRDTLLSPDAQANLERLPSGITLKSISSLVDANLTNEVIVDALFGSGLSRSLGGEIVEVIHFVNQLDATVVSVDVPSGISADAEFYSLNAIKATHTYSFQFPKHSFFFKEYESFVGNYTVLDIGLLEMGLSQLDLKTKLIDESLVKSIVKPRGKYDHKGTFGHACLGVGSKGMLGAALLSARACLRTGVGLLTLNVPACAYGFMQSSVPEAVVKVDQNEDCLSEWLGGNFTSVGVGCGLSVSDTTDSYLVNLLLDESLNNVVIDADGLNLIGLNKASKRLLNFKLITPHPKEFDRLFGVHTSTIERYNTQLKMSKELGCYILLKGAHTHITTPDGFTFINTTGNPGMATAGSGDVLTGIITGLLAQGYSKTNALILGAYLHGWAGDLAAERVSENSLIASDIVDAISEFWKVYN